MLRIAVGLKVNVGARAPGVYAKNPKNEVLRGKLHLSEKFWNCFARIRDNTPINVLCSNFTEIGRLQEVGEMMRCFGDKKFAKCGFLRPFGGER